MLTERERDEVVAAVARDLGVAVSPNDPVFVAVAANELVLGASRRCRRRRASCAISRMPSEPGRRSSSPVSPKR